MPKPISRREMIRRLRELGWGGPFPVGKYPIMLKGNQTVHISTHTAATLIGLWQNEF